MRPTPKSKGYTGTGGAYVYTPPTPYTPTPTTTPDQTPMPTPTTTPTAPTSDILGPVLHTAVQTLIDAALAAHVSAPAPTVIRIDVVRKDGAIVAMPAGSHPTTIRLIKHAAGRRHVMLKGPAGSGKTHGAEAAAAAMGLEPYTLSLGPQTTMSEFFGYTNASDGTFVPGFVYEPYVNGGMLILDELDACNAQILVALNAMLSNGHYRWKNGVRSAKHPDFVVVACGNTFGRGADALYVGRQQLDAATLDRFVITAWDYDETLEAALVDAHAGDQVTAARAWLAELRTYRAIASELRLRVVLGMRKAIFGAAMLRDGDSMDLVRTETLINHVSADDYAKLVNAAKSRKVAA